DEPASRALEDARAAPLGRGGDTAPPAAAGGDGQLALGCGRGCAPGWSATAARRLVAAALLPLGELPPLRLRLGLLLPLGRGRARSGARLLPPAPATATAATLRLGGAGFGVGRLGGRVGQVWLPPPPQPVP